MSEIDKSPYQDENCGHGNDETEGILVVDGVLAIVEFVLALHGGAVGFRRLLRGQHVLHDLFLASKSARDESRSKEEKCLVTAAAASVSSDLEKHPALYQKQQR